MPSARKPVGSGRQNKVTGEVNLFLEPASTLPSPYLNSYKNLENTVKTEAPVPPEHTSPSVADRYSQHSTVEEAELSQHYIGQDDLNQFDFVPGLSQKEDGMFNQQFEQSHSAFAPSIALDDMSKPDPMQQSYYGGYVSGFDDMIGGQEVYYQADTGRNELASGPTLADNDHHQKPPYSQGMAQSFARNEVQTQGPGSIRQVAGPLPLIDTHALPPDEASEFDYGPETNDSEYHNLAAEFNLEVGNRTPSSCSDRPENSYRSTRSRQSLLSVRSRQPVSPAQLDPSESSPRTFKTENSFDAQITNAIADLKVSNTVSEIPEPSFAQSGSAQKLDALDETHKADQELGIGQPSAYIRYIYFSVGDLHTKSKPCHLPVGSRATRLTKQMAVPPELLRKAMDIRYTHLQPRMLASEVDDDDDDENVQHAAAAQPSIYPREQPPSTSAEAAASSPSRRSSTSTESVVADVGRVRLFVANPDSDDD